MSIWTFSFFSSRIVVEALLVRIAEERHHDSLDVVLTDDRRQLGGCSEHADPAEVAPQLLRIGIDEADDVDAVLLVLEKLPRDQLADVARADDDGVLNERGAAA